MLYFVVFNVFDFTGLCLFLFLFVWLLCCAVISVFFSFLLLLLCAVLLFGGSVLCGSLFLFAGLCVMVCVVLFVFDSSCRLCYDFCYRS